jgi:hypothetical protein
MNDCKNNHPIPGGECRQAVSSASRLNGRLAARRTVITLAAIAIVCSGAVTLRRIVLQRADFAALTARPLQPGELIYLVNDDGTVTLRVGDGATDYGRVPTDPAAVRIASQRVLDPMSDYYVETFGGVTANADGSYSFGVAAIAATGGVRIVATDTDVYLSAVTYESGGQDLGDPPGQPPPITMSPDEFTSTSTNVATITATPSGDAWLKLSNLVVSAWVDRTPIGTTNDMRNTIVHVADATDASSPTTLGQMQTWLRNNEGKHWSLWPALGHVYLAGYHLISGTNAWTIGEIGQNLVIANRGHRIATFTQASDTNAAPAILAAIYNTNATFSIWIDASTAATRAPEIGSVISLTPPVAWLPTATSSNSWPSTVDINGTNCYLLVCPAPDASRFFRVFFERATTTPPTLDVRALSIDGVPLASTLDGKLGTNATAASIGAMATTERVYAPTLTISTAAGITNTIAINPTNRIYRLTVTNLTSVLAFDLTGLAIGTQVADWETFITIATTNVSFAYPATNANTRYISTPTVSTTTSNQTLFAAWRYWVRPNGATNLICNQWDSY